MSTPIASFDIDGVIFMGPGIPGVNPGPGDVIITGRSIEEAPETMSMLSKKGISSEVFFNQLPFDKKTRVSSGQHKGNTIMHLISLGRNVVVHYEDDPIQVEEIKKICGSSIQVVELKHSLVEKENVRHTI